MPDFVLRSKLVSEKIEVTFDFTDELEWGDTMQSWSCSVETLTGDDQSPELLLAQRIRNVGKTVKQQFYRGVPGCIYSLICDVVTSNGAKLRKTGKLAILPDGALNPPFYATLYTTPPYPIDVVEALAFAVAPLRSHLDWRPFPVDGMAAVATPQAGNLYGGGKTYSIASEGMQATATPQAGSLFGNGKTYAGLAEGMMATVQPASGNLFGAGLSYTIAPHSIQCTVQPLSGTLT